MTLNDSIKFESNFLAFNIRAGGNTHDRICEIALVLVKEGEIIDQYFTELLPPPNPLYENDWNQERYKDCPTLKEAWKEIETYFEEVEYVTAFNLSVHKSNLEKSLAVYGISLPKKQFFCAYNLAKDNLKEVQNPVFDNVCFALNIDNAQGDTECLSKAIAVANMIPSIESIMNKSIDEYFSNKPTKKEAIAGFFQKQANSISSSDGFVSDFMTNLPFTKPSGSDYFIDKSIVITGEFSRYPSRQELEIFLKEQGAVIRTTISSKTSIVIIGDGAGPSKIQKIIDLVEKGQAIKVISQQDLYDFADKTI